MPRFNERERRVLIDISKGTKTAPYDDLTKAVLRNVLRKLRQSENHHAWKALEEKKP
jgi:hypothetical protein